MGVMENKTGVHIEQFHNTVYCICIIGTTNIYILRENVSHFILYSDLNIVDDFLAVILIHILINLDHNPLVSSIWCQVHPGQGGHHAGAAQQQQQ